MWCESTISTTCNLTIELCHNSRHTHATHHMRVWCASPVGKAGDNKTRTKNKTILNCTLGYQEYMVDA